MDHLFQIFFKVSRTLYNLGRIRSNSIFRIPLKVKRDHPLEQLHYRHWCMDLKAPKPCLLLDDIHDLVNRQCSISRDLNCLLRFPVFHTSDGYGSKILLVHWLDFCLTLSNGRTELGKPHNSVQLIQIIMPVNTVDIIWPDNHIVH